MADVINIARSELILGGQRSGKSRRAELLAREWLAQSPDHKAVMIATAQAWDDEMHQRIARHQQDRAERVPGMQTVEEPIALGEALARHGCPQTTLVIDCLTLWLTNLLMPYLDGQGRQNQQDPESNPENGSNVLPAQKIQAQVATLLIAIENAPGPVILVGNEIGLGVIPMGRETRDFVDALGRLNQEVAAACRRVTFMAAGLPLVLKDSS
ncbi:MAG: bifunctional adenosylcobinamide kinase/adenosylcobinamide-phosphate guanylyltransferase [Polaromonas sp.]|nr:bifunctional adenosylcobinamide kinase/adenosylcobinamide-phosphate guanylyltransferase [Polaromonas sp.]